MDENNYFGISKAEAQYDTNDFLIDNGCLEKYSGKSTEVVIPDCVTHIGTDAFKGIDDIKSIYLPYSLTDFNGFSLRECTGVTEIIVDPYNPNLMSRDNCVLTKDGKTLVAGCQSSVIPSGVTHIGKGAFYNCINLTNVKIPDGVTEIGDSAFFGCKGLESIEIPNGVKQISYSAFSNCVNLTSVKIPNSVTQIGIFAFYRCEELSSINIQSGVTHIDNFAFAQCRNLTKVIIPESVTQIGKFAFSTCEQLTDLIIPSSVTHIDDFAFARCRNLTKIIIPESVISVGRIVFGDMNLALYCRAESKPQYWDDMWNHNDYKGTEHQVIWGYKGD